MHRWAQKAVTQLRRLCYISSQAVSLAQPVQNLTVIGLTLDQRFQVRDSSLKALRHVADQGVGEVECRLIVAWIHHVEVEVV